MIKQIFPDIRSMSKSEELDCILREVAHEHGIPPYVIKSKKRTHEAVRAKKEFCRKAVKIYTQTEVANFLGKHPSSIHNLTKY